MTFPTCLLNTQRNLKVDEPMFDLNYEESDTDVYKELRTTLGNKNLKIGHINVNGLFNKLNDIHSLPKEVNFDVRGFTETHLTDEISNNTLIWYQVLVWQGEIDHVQKEEDL